MYECLMNVITHIISYEHVLNGCETHKWQRKMILHETKYDEVFISLCEWAKAIIIIAEENNDGFEYT